MFNECKIWVLHWSSFIMWSYDRIIYIISLLLQSRVSLHFTYKIHPSSQWHLFEQRNSLKWKLCHMSRCNVISLMWITSQASHHKQDTTWRWQRWKKIEDVKVWNFKRCVKCLMSFMCADRRVLQSAVVLNKLRMTLLVSVKRFFHPIIERRVLSSNAH